MAPSGVHDEPSIGELLEDGARALWHEGDLRTGRERFEAAYRLAQRENDPQSAASAVLGLSGLWAQEYHGFTAAAVVRDRLRRTLSCVAPDSSLALRLRAQLVAEADDPAALPAVLAVVEQAVQLGDPVATAEALGVAHYCLMGPDHGWLRRHLAEDLIAESSRTQRPGDLLTGMLSRTIDRVLAADPDAQRSLAELRDLLAVRGHLAVGYSAQLIGVLFEIRAGRFEQAEQNAKESAEAGAAAGHPAAPAWYAAQLIAIRWYQGRVGELLPMLQEMADSPSLSSADYSYQSALALASAVAGELRLARSTLASLTGRTLTAIPRSFSWLATMYGVVETAYLLGEGDAAVEAYDLLRPYAALPIAGGPAITCFGSVEHALGLAKLTVGDFRTAAEHLRRAVRDNAALGHRPAAVLARLRLADALARTSTVAQHRAARQEDRTARGEALRLGMNLPKDPTPRTVDAPGEVTPAVGSAPICTRRGRYWWVEAAGRSAVVGHCRGMAYLAVLFANPDRETPSLELASGSTGTDNRAAPSAAAVVSQPSVMHPVLDEHAIQNYWRRVKALEQEIERCEEAGDRARAAQAHAERDWLQGQLRSARGLAGRVRSFPTAEERARIAVGKAIRRALLRIADADPELGHLLAGAVRTGHRCVYTPSALSDGTNPYAPSAGVRRGVWM